MKNDGSILRNAQPLLNRKLIYVATVILFIAQVLTACKQQEDYLENNSSSLPTLSDESRESNQLGNKELPNRKTTKMDSENNFLEDEDGLVKIEIENGEANISFQVDSWNKIYGSQSDGFYHIPDSLQDVFFSIIPRSGSVVDACVARISSMGTYLPTDDFELPIVVLLMDDGSIEWFYANPNATLYSYEFSSSDLYSIDTYEKLVCKYSGEFVSINYAPNNENSDDMRIYAINSYGYSFDFREMYLENQLYDHVWVCEFQEHSLYGYFTVDENDYATFILSDTKYTDLASSEIYLEWSGTAYYVTSPDSDLPLGTITLELELASQFSDDEQILPQNITGSYLTEITFDQNGQMTLYHNIGDKFYPQNGETLVFTSWFYSTQLENEE